MDTQGRNRAYYATADGQPASGPQAHHAMLLLAAMLTIAMGHNVVAYAATQTPANYPAKYSRSNSRYSVSETRTSEPLPGIQQPRYALPSVEEAGATDQSNTPGEDGQKRPKSSGETTTDEGTTPEKVQQASWTSVWRHVFAKGDDAPPEASPTIEKRLPEASPNVEKRRPPAASQDVKARPPALPRPEQMAAEAAGNVDVSTERRRLTGGDAGRETIPNSQVEVQSQQAITATKVQVSNDPEVPSVELTIAMPKSVVSRWSKITKQAAGIREQAGFVTALGKQVTTMRNDEVLRTESADSSADATPSQKAENKRSWDDSPLLLPFSVTNRVPAGSTNAEHDAAGAASTQSPSGAFDSPNLNSLARQFTMSTTDDWRSLAESVDDDSILSDEANSDRGWSHTFPSMTNPFLVAEDPALAAQGFSGAQLAAYQETLPAPPPQDADDAFKDDTAQGGTGSEQGGGNEPKTLADAEKLGEEPEDNTLQFLRTQTVLLEPGESQFDIGINYLFTENSFPILLLDSGVPVGTDDVLFRIRELTFPLEYRFGVLKRVQGFVGAPIGWSNTQVALGNYEQFQNDGGFGDIDFGTTIQLIEGNAECPHGLVTISATAPTGGDPFGPAAVLAQSAPSLGQGFWSISGNALCIQTYDPLAFFYGVGVEHFFARHFNDFEFEPGNSWNYTLGVGFAVNDRVTLSTRFLGSYVEEVRVNRQRRFGTNVEPMSIRMAATISKPCDRLVEPFVEFGITDSAVESFFGITWTY